MMSAEEARFYARQRTFVNGLLEQIVHPAIQKAAAFGTYQTEVFLHHFPQCSEQTKMIALNNLLGKGYKAQIKNDILTIEWK